MLKGRTQLPTDPYKPLPHRQRDVLAFLDRHTTRARAPRPYARPRFHTYIYPSVMVSVAPLPAAKCWFVDYYQP